MSESLPLAQLTVKDVLTRWPETAVVFKRHKMVCIGCAVSQFCSISEASAIYNIPLDEFVAQLERFTVDSG